eukprot:6202243-Pleurochrysis_carterae.AAC.2
MATQRAVLPLLAFGPWNPSHWRFHKAVPPSVRAPSARRRFCLRCILTASPVPVGTGLRRLLDIAAAAIALSIHSAALDAHALRGGKMHSRLPLRISRSSLNSPLDGRSAIFAFDATYSNHTCAPRPTLKA